MENEVMQLRQWFWQLLKQNPDYPAAGLASYLSISRSAAEAFLSHRIEESRLKVGSRGYEEFLELRRRIECGDILLRREESVALTARPVNVRSRKAQRQRNFYQTPTADRIAQVLDHCAEQAIIGVITADYGVGKSHSVRHWQATKGLETPSCYYEFDEFTRRNLRDFMGSLCEALGAEKPARAHEQMRAVVRYLRANPQLIIFDQCETVSPAVLQIIRQIHDAAKDAGVGIVLLSSPLLQLRLQTPRLRQEIGSLSSRVGVWLALDGIDRASAAAIIRQEGISKINDAAIDLLVRMTRGSMRRLMAVTDLITTKHADQPVTERVVEQVAQHLWGMQVDPRRRAA